MSKYSHTLQYNVEYDDEIKIGDEVFYLKAKAEFDITTELCVENFTITEQSLEGENGMVEPTKQQQVEIEMALDRRVEEFVGDNAEDISRDVETDYEEHMDYARHGE